MAEYSSVNYSDPGSVNMPSSSSVFVPAQSRPSNMYPVPANPSSAAPYYSMPMMFPSNNCVHPSATYLPIPERTQRSSPRLSDFNFMFNLDGNGFPCSIPPSVVDCLMMSLRGEGYPEFAVSEVSSAITSLAKYGIISRGQHPITGVYFGYGAENSTQCGWVDQTAVKKKEELYVPDKKVGAILGSAGKTIDEIQKATGASIQLSKKGEFKQGTTERIVSICGNDQQIEYAKTMIHQKMQEAEIMRGSRDNRAIRTVI